MLHEAIFATITTRFWIFSHVTATCNAITETGHGIPKVVIKKLSTWPAFYSASG
jgi:hypothetical protein